MRSGWRLVPAASAHQLPVATPSSCDNPESPQWLPHVSWGHPIGNCCCRGAPPGPQWGGGVFGIYIKVCTLQSRSSGTHGVALSGYLRR